MLVSGKHNKVPVNANNTDNADNINNSDKNNTTNEDNKRYLSILLKAMAALFFVWAIVRSVYHDYFILIINGGKFGDIYYKSSDITHSILRWGHNIATVAFPMAAFFKSRLFKNIAVFVCLPFALAAALNFDTFIVYYMREGGRGLIMPLGFREFYLAADFWMAITFPLLLVCCDKHIINIKNKREVASFFAVLPFVIISMCPVNIPQSIFGYTNMSYGALSLGNIIWILLIITEVLVLNCMFRFKPYRERFMLCMFLALVCFVEYNSLFMMGFTIRRLPMQLCNLGTYFFVIALLIKNEKFFNFVFLANITGAIIAILSPDPENGGFASFWAFHYFVEHTLVLTIPLMCNLLRIFPRVTNAKAAIKHMTIGFACYFFACFILGTVLNGITDITGQSKVNFFYIFDVGLVNTYLPLLRPLTKGILLFNRFVIYPFFQITVFAVFWFLCVVVYFLVQKLYEILDDQFELRLARINLQEKLTKRKSKAIRQYSD